MKNSSYEDKCDCPIECNAIDYSYYFVSSPFNPEELCPSKMIRNRFLMKEYYKNVLPPQLLRRMRMFYTNISDGQQENCRRNVPYRAEVVFRLATDTMTVTVASKRLSFFDKLSSFGIKNSKRTIR